MALSEAHVLSPRRLPERSAVALEINQCRALVSWCARGSSTSATAPKPRIVRNGRVTRTSGPHVSPKAPTRDHPLDDLGCHCSHQGRGNGRWQPRWPAPMSRPLYRAR
jgi:hypothetical protein